MKKYGIFVLVTFFAQLCLGQLGPLPLLDSDQLNQRRQQFEYDVEWSAATLRTKSAAKLKMTEMRMNYISHQSQQSRSFRFDIYQSSKFSGQTQPVIILFPPLQGLSPFDTGFAKYFAKQGYIAVISHVARDIESFNSVEPLMREFVDATIDNRVLVDYLQTLKNVDVNRIGVFGISLGGIRAAIFYGIESRIHATSIVVGGGNLPGVMAYSEVKSVIQLRKKLMAANNLHTQEELEGFLRIKMIWDPIYSTQLREGHDTLMMVVGEKDDKVMARYQHELLTAYNPGIHLHYNKNHVPTAASVFLKKNKIKDFFDRFK